MPRKQTIRIGVDLGGTKIEAIGPRGDYGATVAAVRDAAWPWPPAPDGDAAP